MGIGETHHGREEGEFDICRQCELSQSAGQVERKDDNKLLQLPRHLELPLCNECSLGFQRRQSYSGPIKFSPTTEVLWFNTHSKVEACQKQLFRFTSKEELER